MQPGINSPDSKNNTDQTTAVREISETTHTSQHYRIEGFKGVLNWPTIMPRDAMLEKQHRPDVQLSEKLVSPGIMGTI